MLYAIAGNGTGPVKEITAALKDLRDKATKAEVDFWFIIEGKDEPTATDNAILKWATQNEIWFEVYSSTGTTYDGAQETTAAEDVYAAMLERIQERTAENEEASLLVLLDDEVEDTDLQRFVEQVIDGDGEVFQLNGEMAKITLEEEGDGEAEAPAPAKSAAKKAAAGATKKAAAPTKAVSKKAASAGIDPDASDEEAIEATATVVYTPAELAKMTVAELGAVARSQGIDSKGLGKKELIEAIEAKLRPVALNGDGDVLVVLHMPGSIVIKHLSAADALALVAQ